MVSDPANDFPKQSSDNPAFDPDRARRAARDPERPGTLCQAPPGSYAPHIDRMRCEGKADCVAVCPYGVFEVRRIDEEDFRALSFLGRLKSRAHGRRSAYTPGAASCQACGLCVVACPERAISLAASVASAPPRR